MVSYSCGAVVLLFLHGVLMLCRLGEATDTSSDLNFEFSDVFSEENAVALSLQHTERARKYTRRHMEIIEELAERRRLHVRSSIRDLFLEAQERFKLEDLERMNEGTFGFYVKETTRGRCKRKIDGSSESACSKRKRVGSSEPAPQRKYQKYTPAHDKIITEILKSSECSSGLLDAVNRKFSASNLAPIPVRSLYYRLNKLRCEIG